MDKKKLFMIVSIAILAIAIIGGASTYAWYIWSTDENNETKIVTNIGTARVFYNGGANIENAILKPTNNREEDGIVKEITVKTDKETTYKISFNLYLDVTNIDEGLKDVSFRYALYKEGTTDAVKEGNFSQSYLDSNLTTCATNSTRHIVLVSDETVTTTTQKYTLYIWIDGENYVNPSEMQGKTFSFKLHADGENAVLGETIVEHINNLYNNASKTVVTNNEIDYNYATSVSLMNDRLGGTAESLDGGNIRYYGSNPNNYIDIGDVYSEDTVINNMDKNKFLTTMAGVTDTESCHEFFDCNTNYSGLGNLFDIEFADASACKKVFDYESTDEMCETVTKKAGDPVLYRIIGLFKDAELSNGQKTDLIKVIREDSIGNFAWDLKDAEGNDYNNNWHEATLNNVLNNGYLKSSSGITHYYYDLLTGSPTTVTTDFTKIGINSIQNKVAEVVWNLGGWDDDAYPNEIYEYERGESKCTDCTYETTWPGKVALAYPSDQGYGADLSNCSSTLWNYIECNSVNWMSSMSNGTVVEWLLAPNSSASDYAWDVNCGGVDSNRVVGGIGVRPVFYIDASLGLLSGDGSEDNPYVVG